MDVPGQGPYLRNSRDESLYKQSWLSLTGLEAKSLAKHVTYLHVFP